MIFVQLFCDNFLDNSLSYYDILYNYHTHFFIRPEKNDIKNRDSQLSWYPTLIFCQMLINIIKKRKKKYIKTGGHKLKLVKPHKSVSRPQTYDKKIKTTHKYINI